MFTHISGNDEVKRYLTLAIEKEMVGNSLLFAGPQGVGKGQFAIAFASNLLCRGARADLHRRKIEGGNHPDLHFYRPEGKTGMHSIQAMRQLGEEVYLPPYEAERKVFILYEADRMMTYSANALLKTFEEPSLDTVIILISSAPELLLPTIRSRCRALHFKPVEGSSQSDPLGEKMIALLSRGRTLSYNELAAAAKEFAEGITERSKLSEETIRSELMLGYTEKLTPQQRESIDKEVEGALSLQITRDCQVLFDAILGWYRDLLLLSVKGDNRQLFFPHALNVLQAAQAAGRQLPLERIFTAIETAKLALARSTTLHLCIETLLLRLDLI